MADSSEPHHPLQPEFEKLLPPDLARALVRQYVRLKQRAWSGDDEGVQESGGKVAEHALRGARHLAVLPLTGLREEIRDMAAEVRALENLPKAQADDAVRVVIPRVIAALYTLRNKRSGGHTASEVDPSRADAALTEGIADWLMAEFFRIGTKLPLDQAEAAVQALVERRIPAVYKVGAYRRVLKSDLAPPAEIMTLLYAEASGATVSELQSWTGIPRTSLNRHLDKLEEQRLIRMETEGRTKRGYLLPTGQRRVEEERWIEPS